jgi:hypothetical protein
MKNSSKAAGVLAVSAIALMLSAQPAFADSGYIDDAVTALQGDATVYVDSDVSLEGQGNISSALDGTNIDVVVLPELATSTFSPSEIASQIRSNTGETTVVVVIDKNSIDTIAVSSSSNQTEIATVLNQALTESGGEAGPAISSSIQEVKDLSDSGTVIGANDGAGISVGFVLVPVIIVIAAAAVAISYVLGRRRNRNVITTLKTEAPTNFSDLMPSSLVPLLKQMSDLMKKHNKLQDKSLSAELRAIIDNLQELFKRLNKKGSNSQQRMAEVEYADKLPKLIEALGTNYYVDIVEHDDLWDNSNERLEEVAVAVEAVKKQLVQNIRQVNASKDLEFKVALGSLTRSSDNPSVDDVFKN